MQSHVSAERDCIDHWTQSASPHHEFEDDPIIPADAVDAYFEEELSLSYHNYSDSSGTADFEDDSFDGLLIAQSSSEHNIRDSRQPVELSLSRSSNDSSGYEGTSLSFNSLPGFDSPIGNDLGRRPTQTISGTKNGGSAFLMLAAEDLKRAAAEHSVDATTTLEHTSRTNLMRGPGLSVEIKSVAGEEAREIDDEDE
eukprot:SAG31_NODE_13883_length_840_cov_1.071525_1_plen_196_part_01